MDDNVVPGVLLDYFPMLSLIALLPVPLALLALSGAVKLPKISGSKCSCYNRYAIVAGSVDDPGLIALLWHNIAVLIYNKNQY